MFREIRRLRGAATNEYEHAAYHQLGCGFEPRRNVHSVARQGGNVVDSAGGGVNSIMFPSLFSLGIAGSGDLTGKASGILMSAAVGAAVIPVLQGALARQNRRSTTRSLFQRRAMSMLPSTGCEATNLLHSDRRTVGSIF